jgi:taurine transport system substrate-binding protein
MNMHRYKAYSSVLSAITLLFFMTITAGEAWAEAKPEKLVIGYQEIANPEIVVKDLGWNEKALEIPVNWIKYDSGRHVSRALEDGKVDIGLVGTGPSATAISRGVPIEVIWIHDVIGDSEALAVKKDNNIQTIKNLIGKRVATPFGSTAHYHLMVALNLASIPPEHLNIINFEPREMPAAWQQGDLDAAFVWQPTLSLLLSQGGKVILSARQMAERGFPTADLCVARQEFANKYPSVVIQYLKNLNKAVTFCRSKPEEAAAAIARQFDITPEEAARQMKGNIFLSGEEQVSGKFMGDMQFHFGLYTTLKDTADFLAKAKQIETSPPWPVFMRAVNPVYIRKALE